MRWLMVALAGRCALHRLRSPARGDRRPLLCAPRLLGQAWWVPLLFACASVAAVAGARTIRGCSAVARWRRRPSGEIAGDGVAFVTAYAFTAYASPLPNVVAAVLGGLWLARVLRDVPAWLIAYSISWRSPSVARCSRRAGRRSASSTITRPTSSACRAGCRGSTCTSRSWRPASSAWSEIAEVPSESSSFSSRVLRDRGCAAWSRFSSPDAARARPQATGAPAIWRKHRPISCRRREAI